MIMTILFLFRQNERIESLLNVLRNRFGRDIIIKNKNSDQEKSKIKLIQSLNEESDCLQELSLVAENSEKEKTFDKLANYLDAQHKTDQFVFEIKSNVLCSSESMDIK